MSRHFDAEAVIAAAAAILRLLGPDPDAATHVLVLHHELGDFCKIPDCPGTHAALGLCKKHYWAHRRATRNEDFVINRTATRKAVA